MTDMYDKQEPKISIVYVVGFLLLALMFGTGAAVSAYFDRTTSEEIDSKVLALPNVEWQRMREAAAAQLNRYQYVDKEKGIVKIPLARAMELVAAELGSADQKVLPKTAACK